MISSGTDWFTHLGRLGFFPKAALLMGALGICLLPVASLAFAWNGHAGLMAAAAACCVCLIAGLNGLGLCALLNRRSQTSPLIGLLAGMLVRMGIPLVLLLVMASGSHPLIDAGFAYYLIGLYQVMLLVEVILIVPRAPTMALPGRRTGDASNGTSR